MMPEGNLELQEQRKSSVNIHYVGKNKNFLSSLKFVWLLKANIVTLSKVFSVFINNTYDNYKNKENFRSARILYLK